MKPVAQCFRILVVALCVIASGCATRGPGLPFVKPQPSPALSSQQKDFADALALYSQGLIYEMHREYDQALDVYQRAIELDPRNEELYFRCAMGLLQLQRQDEAVTLMEGLVAQQPQSAKALRWLALIYRAADEVSASEQTYKRWIELTPHDFVPYVQLASLYLRENRQPDAINVLESGLSRVTNAADILREIAEIHLNLVNMADEPDKAARHLAAATHAYERISEIDPDDQLILNRLGELYLRGGKADRAIAIFEKMQEQQPNDLSVKEHLADSYLASGDREQAVAVLTALAGLQPDNYRIQYFLGDLYHQMGDMELAEENYQAAIQAQPREPTGYLKLALMRMFDDPEAAVAVLQEGMAKIPNDEALTKTLAHVYFADRQYEEAVEMFGQALTIMEGMEEKEVNPAFYFNYAIAMQEANRIEGAAGFLAAAMLENPAYLDAYVQFVLRQDDEASVQRGVATLVCLSEANPEEGRIYYYLGLLYNYTREHEDAVTAFEKTLEFTQDEDERELLINEQFYFWYGSACERLGQFEKAEELFHRCLEMDPKHAEAYNYLAYMWAERGIDLDRALEYVEKALEQNPESGAFIDTLGWVYYQQGQYDEALTQIEKATKLIPDDPTITDHLGDVMFKIGGVEQALPSWKRAFVLDPENDAVSQKLTDHGVDLVPLREEAEELKQQLKEEAEEAPAPELPPDLEAIAPEMPVSEEVPVTILEEDLVPEPPVLEQPLELDVPPETEPILIAPDP